MNDCPSWERATIDSSGSGYGILTMEHGGVVNRWLVDNPFILIRLWNDPAAALVATAAIEEAVKP